jgi:hypothetical protein
MSSNPRRTLVYFMFHRPTRGTGSGCATSSLCLTLYVIMFIELCFNFMSFLCIYPSCGQLLFPCLASSLSCTILSQVGLLKIPVTYLGSLGFFLARGPVLLNGCFSKKLMLNRGSTVCSLLSLILYSKRVYFASLTLTVEYCGSGRHMSSNKVITIT